MAAISKISQHHLEALARVVGDTSGGLTGTQIGSLLRQCKIEDVEPTITKWKRLFAALDQKQERDGCANNVLHFVQTVLAPVRYVGNPAYYDQFRGEVNEVLAFSGFAVGDDGKLRQITQAATLSEAQERAGTLRTSLLRRNVHSDVLQFCRAELLQENYFHAVFEATKSIADKIRRLTGLAGDGADLIDPVFGINAPMLAINSLRTETEQSEQKGFANLIRGVFGTFRNVTAHAPKITWPINEQDALDLLSIISYIHRRLDMAVVIPRSINAAP
jgi:uncharacterized protein (TIGR02391 family)